MCHKVFAVVVIYEPDIKELFNIIEKLSMQVDEIVLCNNSSYKVKFDSCIQIYNFECNLGIAKAQSIGMEWAFGNGADFVLQMDQDSIPDEGMVYELLKCYNELENDGLSIGLVGPQDYDKDTGDFSKARFDKGKVLKKSYQEVSSTLSSGSLIPFNAYQSVGGMKDELFIDAVDSEYCWRLKMSGFLVIKNTNALLAHKLGAGKITLLNKIHLGVSSPIRNYYQVRNVFLLVKEEYVPFFWKISQFCKVVFKLLFYPILMPSGRIRIKYLYRGLYDGLRGKSGPYVN